MKVPAHYADRISSCAILLAGAVGGVLVFVVALPLALSSPFPTPKQSEWVIPPPYHYTPPPRSPSRTGEGLGEDEERDGEVSSFQAPPMLPPQTGGLRIDPPMVMVALHPASEPEPITFAERWLLDVAESGATAAPAATEAPSVEAPTQATRLAPPGKAVEAQPSLPRLRGREGAGRISAGALDPVEQYLWEVYQRNPIKSDSTGNFTWKDLAAAKRLGVSVKAYVIGGMDPDFREQLYHAGRAMDASGIRWSMLSAFRDDYRQRLAAGFKAHGGNSQHGGSNATGGYGYGRAVDITSAEGDPSAAWHWIDAHGAKFGLRRPMPSADPAHVQPRNSFHDLAHQLREARVKLENGLRGAAIVAAAKASTVAQADEAGAGRRVSR
jgi:hypothetical protein